MNRRLREILKEQNIKSTAAREMILEILTNAKSPLSYEQIRSQMAVEIDKATFYRNIALFEEAKLIQKFESDERKRYFELSKKAHAHFVCEACHGIICIDFEIDHDIQQHQIKNILLKGVCRDCK